LLKGDGGCFRAVRWGEQTRPLGRGLQRLRNHDRNRLICVTHAIVLKRVDPEVEWAVLDFRIHGERRHIAGRHDFDHAGVGFRRAGIQRENAALGDRADRHHRMEHTVRVIVRRKCRRACDFKHALAPGHRLANI
jgi:hypothetical protein